MLLYIHSASWIVKSYFYANLYVGILELLSTLRHVPDLIYENTKHPLT